uniref:Myb/SANT-like DNA-binding domain-containing protein n=1 Tax=Magallana gigas TaxID=29159 RepID=A0A8W8I1B1_MAGGI
MKGSGSKGKHGQVKESTWRSIAETLNLNYKNDRDNETVKKKFNNIKQRGKEKIDMIRRPKTGGCPAPPSLTASEDVLMQALDGRPQVCGLSEGIDTDAVDDPASVFNAKSIDVLRSSVSRRIANQDNLCNYVPFAYLGHDTVGFPISVVKQRHYAVQLALRGPIKHPSVLAEV